MKYDINCACNDFNDITTNLSLDDINEKEIKISKIVNSWIQRVPNMTGEITDNVKLPLNQHMPIVCIINGAGHNGKDSFVELVSKSMRNVYNCSSVDEVKQIVHEMYNMCDYKMDTGAINNELEKNDSYRSFLHDVKMAWVNACDGPILHCFAKAKAIMLEATNKDSESADIVFFHIREPEEIKRLKNLIETKLGVICITLLVHGLVDPDTYSNDGDRRVLNYDYDIVIENKLNHKKELEYAAWYFAHSLFSSNDSYGINMSDVVVKHLDYNNSEKIKYNKNLLKEG